jgi:hypothetical protein
MPLEWIVIAGLVKQAGKIMSDTVSGFSVAHDKLLEMRDKDSLRRIQEKLEPINTQMSATNIGKELSIEIVKDFLKGDKQKPEKWASLQSVLEDAVYKLQALISSVEQNLSGLLKMSKIDTVTDLVTAQLQEMAFRDLRKMDIPNNDEIVQLKGIVSHLEELTKQVRDLEKRISEAIG